jgi:hypothetical protein
VAPSLLTAGTERTTVTGTERIGEEGAAVTTTADTEDPNDGVVSLRKTINAANANPCRDVIEFQINSLIFGPPPHVIVIDGTNTEGQTTVPPTF